MRVSRSSSAHSATRLRGQDVLYKDKRFTITLSDIKTPTLYYPIEDTVGRVRRDIQFAAIGYSALVLFALLLYIDLWRIGEILAMSASVALALGVGFSVSILQLDARGFPARMFIARTKTVRAIFEAISAARARSLRHRGGPEDANSISDNEA